MDMSSTQRNNCCINVMEYNLLYVGDGIGYAAATQVEKSPEYIHEKHHSKHLRSLLQSMDIEYILRAHRPLSAVLASGEEFTVVLV